MPPRPQGPAKNKNEPELLRDLYRVAVKKAIARPCRQKRRRPYVQRPALELRRPGDKMIGVLKKKTMLRPTSMGKRSINKTFEFQRYPQNDLEQASYGHVCTKQKFQPFGKARKKQMWGRCWAKIGLRKTQADVCLGAA